MNTWHIHIGGLVQGVGFRPHACRVAAAMNINGEVSNGNDGVHIHFNAAEPDAERFCRQLVESAPANAVIRFHSCEQDIPRDFEGFRIVESDASARPDLLLAPDLATCHNCLEEIKNHHSHRYHYAFTTCLECGPRYSITTSLPYDREHTTMASLKTCRHCDAEYGDIRNRRHYSQTNSCPQCTIPVLMYDSQGVGICHDIECVLVCVNKALHDGHIVAVKGIGGYLLLCDATRYLTVQSLRDRKNRPAKPFALMYPSIAMMERDLVITDKEKEALASKVAPIVLCQLRPEQPTGICTSVIAPGLDKLGVMLPYTGLLAMIAQHWKKPLIATSGNLSGSPIIYTDEDAMLWLCEQADFIVSFDRDIVAPQDDSVMQISPRFEQKIILRRSRGMAPNYFPAPFTSDEPVLAMGADMKSAFAILDGHNLYISQFLGDQGSYDSQLSLRHTLRHLSSLLHFRPSKVIVDTHPEYFSSKTGREIAAELDIPVTEVQHHKAHFCSVLAENGLAGSSEKVLGVAWDGAGYGDDGQVWGGEFFLLEDGRIDRILHLDYFPQLMGDKMNREARVSAVSLLRNNMDWLMSIKDLFSIAEREFYLKLLSQPPQLLTSSMGRLLDGIAAILKVQIYNSYEGEAAMKLEAEARRCNSSSLDYYPMPAAGNRLDWSLMMAEIMIDKKEGLEAAAIARKVFVSLAMAIRNVATRSHVRKIAFSGGVFQNAFLVDMVISLLGKDFDLYFHKQLSPNDECIALGQLAYMQMTGALKPMAETEKELVTS